MSLLRVNTIESLNGPQGTINMTGNLVVNGVPIAGSTGATGSPGPTGPEGAGGISGATVVYVSADSDPATNGLALLAAYTQAKALAQTVISSATWSYSFNGNLSVYLNYSSFLARSLSKIYYNEGSVPIACQVDSSPAWYTWDGMSFNFSSTIDMMTPIAMGTKDVVTDIITYTDTTLIIAPGYYQLDNTFVIDGEYVNVTSLSGETDVFIYSMNRGDGMSTYPWVEVTANNTTITGISTVLDVTIGMDQLNGSSQLAIGDNLYNLVMKNCIGGQYSFGRVSTIGGGTISGRFVDCKVVGYYGFGSSSAILSGTFIRCEVTTNYGFGSSNSILNGTFIDCVGLYYSFGAYGSTLSGKFIRCEDIGANSFGYSNSTLSGTFNGCNAGSDGFGAASTISNTAVFYNCISAQAGYGYNGDNSGNFYNCVGGFSSWLVLNTPKLYHCVIRTGNSTFGTPNSGGYTRYCVDGYGMTNNQG